MLYRQGDVFIESMPTIPHEAIRQPDLVLAEGDATGHRHRIEDGGTAVLLALGDRTFLEVVSDEATLVHDEHDTIVLPRGTYRYWRQREYDPRRARRGAIGLHPFVVD